MLNPREIHMDNAGILFFLLSSLFLQGLIRDEGRTRQLRINPAERAGRVERNAATDDRAFDRTDRGALRVFERPHALRAGSRVDDEMAVGLTAKDGCRGTDIDAGPAIHAQIVDL